MSSATKDLARKRVYRCCHRSLGKFADDAWLRDQESGHFFDPARMHVLNRRGEQLSVRGPLNIGRPVQGWPVIVLAGASEAGRQLAAETAEVTFGSSLTIDDARAFYADVKARMRLLDRAPGPACATSCRAGPSLAS